MATEARGVLHELQIRSNLHNVAGIVRTTRNQSAYERQLATCSVSARGTHGQGDHRPLLFRRRTEPKTGQGAEAVLTDA
jgi:hypothetical protein